MSFFRHLDTDVYKNEHPVSPDFTSIQFIFTSDSILAIYLEINFVPDLESRISIQWAFFTPTRTQTTLVQYHHH
jgi:hypothetical protein